MEDNDKFKMFLKQENYSECVKIIEDKIIDYVVNQIKSKGIDYEYTDIFDLIDISRNYLDDDIKYIPEKIKLFSIQEEPIEKLERLMEICRIHNIK